MGLRSRVEPRYQHSFQVLKSKQMDNNKNRRKRTVWKTESIIVKFELNQTIERTLSAVQNGKCLFLPHDQVFPLLVFNCSLLLQKITSFLSFLSKRIVLDCFFACRGVCLIEFATIYGKHQVISSCYVLLDVLSFVPPALSP